METPVAVCPKGQMC